MKVDGMVKVLLVAIVGLLAVSCIQNMGLGGIEKRVPTDSFMGTAAYAAAPLEYDIIRDTSSSSLEYKINEKIEDGWELVDFAACVLPGHAHYGTVHPNMIMHYAVFKR